ncbi:aldolase/citrate lyase family protein [Kitasatospora sp. NBC_01287]|uniref:HpcH/HpaI aldolase family protein n=1 Tax=Kitasatospora sp. NBC_01287 TaxID=2903573 RepID=UPI00225517B3|nr:aldolase/citrate lyase family protein [Kitasatospora sp. NBC_01287]MCX4745042.1 aldolase/citrate lyase family protein [Kitasatospora sp. NBC_01287]
MTDIRQRMTDGPVYGLFLVSASALLTEAAACAGVDWAVIDMEAAAMTKADALHQTQALSGTGATAIVRVPCLDRHAIESALDLGVDGVMVPKVDRVEDAELAARCTRYPPQGSRGVNPVRASGYFTSTAGYLATANERVLCVVQVESRESVANSGDIAAVPGVDLLFVGTGDLLMDLGQPGDPTGPAFDQARQTVLAACAAAGKPAGIFAPSTRLARQYAKEGFRFIAVGNEVGLFVQSAQLALNMLRK